MATGPPGSLLKVCYGIYIYLDFKIKSTGLWKFSELFEGEWFGNLVGFNGEHAHRKERGSGLGCLTVSCDLLWK